MPMSASWNSLLRRRDGSSAVEFTLLLPLLAMLLLGVYETGRLMTQWTLLEKNMRAAGLYLARTPLPLTAGARATAERLIRTGRTPPTGRRPGTPAAPCRASPPAASSSTAPATT